jgi:GNAT superfamily N-acetyltransferase
MPERACIAIRVRPAWASDGDRCAEIFLASRQAAFPGQPARSFDLEDYYRSVEDEEVWVAEIDGLVAGFISVFRPENMIRNVFVAPRWQHRGVGSALLEQARIALHGPARLQCLATNQNARAFYERNGWVIETKSHLKVEPFVIYRK